VPDDVEPASVTLRLFADFPVDGSVSVHTVHGDWSEATTTSRNAPNIGEIVSLIPEGSGGGRYVDVDVAPAFTGNGQLDFYLATTSSRYTPFGSRESPNPPQLVVEWDE
ncbi:MAG TPA: DNRLRE domain-containing protein, partial [Acidimicrobiia bacterium]|nr:DNRLRE domain-containing protein [Acidimicrobiia bacterium]